MGWHPVNKNLTRQSHYQTYHTENTNFNIQHRANSLMISHLIPLDRHYFSRDLFYTGESGRGARFSTMFLGMVVCARMSLLASHIVNTRRGDQIRGGLW